MGFTFILKKNKPINKVNRGVSTFKIPTRPESKKVSDLVNRKAGIPFPIIPVKNRAHNLFLGKAV